MYSVFAEMVTGELNFAYCHPEALSLANVTDASSAPVEEKSFPVCGPLLPAAL